MHWKSVTAGRAPRTGTPPPPRPLPLRDLEPLIRRAAQVRRYSGGGGAVAVVADVLTAEVASSGGWLTQNCAL